MKSKIITLISIFVFASCTSVRNVEKTQNEKNQIKLGYQIEEIKKEIKQNNTETLESMLDGSFKSGFIVSEINKIDMRDAKIYSTPLEFNGNKAENIIGIKLYDVVYFKVEYTYKNEEWKITSFKEER